MKKKLPLIAFCCLLQAGYSQDLDELKKLQDQYISAANRAVEPLSKKYVERLETLKAEFSRNGKDKERSYVEREISKLNEAKKAGLAYIPNATDSDDQSEVVDPNALVGEDLKTLYGIWKTSDKRMTFEFKPGRKVTLTQEYETSGGGKSSSTQIYEAKEQDDKIIINRKDYDSSNYKSWYEISIPFSLKELEITYHNVYPQGSSKSIYRLKREIK